MRDILATDRSNLQLCLAELEVFYGQRGIGLMHIGDGWQFHTAPQYVPIVAQLWQTRAPKLSLSMLETLAIIAY